MTTNSFVARVDLHVLKTEFEKALYRQTWTLVGVMFTQAAFIVAVLQLLC